MSEAAVAIQAVNAVKATPDALPTQAVNPAVQAHTSVPADFAAMLQTGLERVSETVAIADARVQAFALDESIPIHEVTMAMGKARFEVELALQVRNRITEGYREIMNMQL